MRRLKQDEVELYFKQEGYELLSIYKLIRIPYWEFDNIENILEKELL